MRSLLKYRIPGEAIVSMDGSFEQVGTEPKGFVVSDFKGDKCYQFNKGNVAFDTQKKSPFVIGHEAYLEDANDLISELRDSGGKTVLSRILAEPFLIDPEVFFKSLCSAYSNAFVYLIVDENLGVWIGATPETLIQRDNDSLHSMALAGTRRTSDLLAWTEKEFEEHEFVADFIESEVEKTNPVNFNRSERKEVVSGPVKHLKTNFSWKSPINLDWSIAKKLHPTPAVSGMPVSDAVEMISKYEKHNRELYTGIIGLIGDETRLFVNLRCAQIIENKLFLYVGGGFTKDSIAEDEWAETENKAATLINVLKNG